MKNLKLVIISALVIFVSISNLNGMSSTKKDGLAGSTEQQILYSEEYATEPTSIIKTKTQIRSSIRSNHNIQFTELKNALIVDFKLATALASKKKVIEIKDRKGRRVFFGEAFSNELASIVPLHKLNKGKYKLIIWAENFELLRDFQRG